MEGKEGYMMKEGGKIASKWQKRYCIIRGTDFCYYKKKVIRFTLFFFLWSFGDEGENGLQVSCLVQRSLIV